jgi:hypothetical protein
MNQFKEMTLRELDSCLQMIDVRTHNEMAFHATLHGGKMEFKKIKRDFEEHSKAELDLMEKIHREAIRRKFEERNKQ